MNAKFQSTLPPAKTGGELLDLYYLDMRSALLETAAAFDRLQRAEGAAATLVDRRMDLLRSACRIVAADDDERVERILQLFSEAAP